MHAAMVAMQVLSVRITFQTLLAVTLERPFHGGRLKPQPISTKDIFSEPDYIDWIRLCDILDCHTYSDVLDVLDPLSVFLAALNQ